MEFPVHTLKDVQITSELITSGGGNYYRNTISFYLTLPEDPTSTTVVKEELDMALEDFAHMTYSIPTASGETRVSFRVHEGKVQSQLTRH